jgi:hypothetical protein
MKRTDKPMTRLDRLAVLLSHKEMKLRKRTTPVHWAFGFLCCYLTYKFGILAGWGMMGIFGVWEHWNDVCDGSKQGAFDWWESFLTYCVGMVILAFLDDLKIVSIGWF